MSYAHDPVAREACRRFLDAHGHMRLGTRVAGGTRLPLSLRAGFVPLMVDYTQEDREAKGLRRLVARESTPPPVPDTVIESADLQPLLLLTGVSGSGKSTALLHLGLTLAGAVAADPDWAPAPGGRPVIRNQTGQVLAEVWRGPFPVPLHLIARAGATLRDLLAGSGPLAERILCGLLDTPVLLILDAAERAGAGAPRLLEDVATLVREMPRLRALVAADADAVRVWRIPQAFVHRRIVDLIEPQRLALRDAISPEIQGLNWSNAGPEVLSRVGAFSLALCVGAPGSTSESEVVAAWLDAACRRNGCDGAHLVDAGTDLYADPEQGDVPAVALDEGDRTTLSSAFVQRQLAARRIAGDAPAHVGQRFAADPVKWMGPVAQAAEIVARDGRQRLDAFLRALLSTPDAAVRDFAVVTAAGISGQHPASVSSETLDVLRAGLVHIVEQGSRPLALRKEAGHALAQHGDPRDLDELIPISGGRFSMGSGLHPNSAPVHEVRLRSFRIARYPVTNALYGRFVVASGRPWRTTDGREPARANSPAVDLTWRDAMACCEWLTQRWRATGQIGPHARVRLPTEAEWERAARGVRVCDGQIYPWPGAWQEDRCNSEEAGFNDTCAVGLFPLGRSPDGCDDMAGQIWEWTSTLWGEDMATPRFRYPYADDGRENASAPPDIRRVLRGACFVSPREKTNCTYRGSLEPDGFWRGNGFRVVVAES